MNCQGKDRINAKNCQGKDRRNAMDCQGKDRFNAMVCHGKGRRNVINRKRKKYRCNATVVHRKSDAVDEKSTSLMEDHIMH